MRTYVGVPRCVCGLVMLVAVVFASGVPLSVIAQDNLPYRRVAHVSPDGIVDVVAWSPNGEMLAIGGDQGIGLYTKTLDEFFRFDDTGGTVQDLAWSPDSELVASVTEYDDRVRIWSVASGELVTTLEGFDGYSSTVAWSPDGSMIAGGDSVLGSDASAVRVWDTATGDEITSIQSHSGTIVAVAWSPDGALLASASTNSQTGYSLVDIWDITTAQTLLSREREAVIGSLAWRSPDGAYLTIGSFDFEFWIGLIEAWDVRSDVVSLISPIIYENGEPVVAWNSDGTILAASTGTFEDWVTLWPVDGMDTHVLEITAWITDIAWHPTDNGLLAVAGYDEQLASVVEIWAVEESG